MSGREALRRVFSSVARTIAVISVALAGAGAAAQTTVKIQRAPLTETQKSLLRIADELLEEAQISYVYGGYQVGDGEACQSCNTCLEAKAPKPKERLARCPICAQCSLDCSHFTELVYRRAGHPYPYLATPLMLSLDGPALRSRYKLVDLGTDLDRAAPGDLLVYDGHVVLLERRHQPQAGLPRHRGDVVHATGGKDIRAPGEGIQRERFIDLARFRGPLRRILRHERLHAELGNLPDRR